MVSGDRSTIPCFFPIQRIDTRVKFAFASLQASAGWLIDWLAVVLLVSVIDFFSPDKRTVFPKSLKSGINKPHTGRVTHVRCGGYCTVYRVLAVNFRAFGWTMVCLSELDPGCYYYASGMALPRSLLHHHHLEPRPRLQNPSPLLHPQTPTPPRFSTFPELDSLGVYTTKAINGRSNI